MPSSKKDILIEVMRRRSIVEACFPKQQDPVRGVIERDERYISILTSRRAGKTNTVLRAICRDAADHPNCKYAYIGLSRVTAENIAWKELEAINEDHNCQLEMQGYRLRALFPNGSELTLYGADQAGWIKKFKGSKYRGAVIDEAGEFDIDLHDFIFRVIKPCLVDHRGFLFLIGTPGVVPSGYWWMVTRPDINERAKGWHHYSWHAFDNPFIVEQFKESIEELREMYGEALEEMPWYRREYLGEWCTDTTNNVYKYSPDRNIVDEWERDHDDVVILSVDPGYTDAAAFMVGAYNKRKSDCLYIIECHREVGMQMEAMANKLMELKNKYGVNRVIGDPDSAHFLAMMRERYRVPVVDAQKQKKQENIEYMNNSFLAGKVKILMPQCNEYGKELLDLKKQFNKAQERTECGITLGDWKEHPKQANDLCDCGLYIHREARNYLYTAPKPKVEHGSAEYYKKVEDKLLKQAQSRLKGNDKWWKTV